MTRFMPAIIERDLATGVFVGSVLGVPGAHTQGETVDEVRSNLGEVLRLLVDNNALQSESEYVATVAVVAP